MKSVLLSLALCLLAPAALAANPVVRLTTNLGDIDIELYPEQAPKTVDNFLRYVKKKFYNGTVFHRVIPGFVAQGGGYGPDLKGRPTDKPIRSEADNGLSNLTGTVAMARQDDPHTATSQFFINLVDNNRLDYRDQNSNRGWGYAVFGKVVQGMDVVAQIAAIPTDRLNGMTDVPTRPVLIKSTKLLPPAPAGTTATEPETAKP